ncbi:MAG: hypothetical protein RR547_12925 [Raoultibacter sp.]
MDFPTTLLKAIKKQFEATNGCKEMGGCESKHMAPYYVKYLEDNLVQPMDVVHVEEYSKGTGVELGEKMRALRSSSAMTFNLLGNKEIHVLDSTVIPKGRYGVQYEYQLSTLVMNPNKANLDARLTSEDKKTVVYCEMKMVEWLLGWMKMLRVSYLDPARYLIPEDEAQIFIELFQKFIVPEANMKGSHKTRLVRFDALQMAKHLLAIYSNLDNEGARTIKLVNCVWEIKDVSLLPAQEERYVTMLAAEKREFKEFACAAEPVFELFSRKGINFSLEYVPFDRFLGCLEKTKEQQRKLARYVM